MDDYIVRGDLAEIDPEVAQLIEHEAARQAHKIILIASESMAPLAVRQAIGSVFQNIYAEGYPSDHTRQQSEAEVLNYEYELPRYRREADKRYYKGVEYADVVEALARQRCKKLFAANGLSADDVFVNVQALSGAPANNAVYSALVEPGDTVMGMDLADGGHLTHGSRANRSGKLYNIVSYNVDSESERLNYDAIAALAQEHRPKIIIAGYSSFPWAPDWTAFREIADSVGAYLFADIAHVAGLTVAGAFPSPLGIADAVTFTTHKTLLGPRGAVIMTHRRDLATKFDRAVFPGEQGGPHMNSIAALAVALKVASTDTFNELQHQIVANAARLAQKLAENGLRVPYGGTDTHLLAIDCKSVRAEDGTPLSGDMAARILDVAGIVANRNTIPGDSSALRPSGVRLGTTWITQRGFREPEVDRLADVIAELLLACKPYVVPGAKARLSAKVDWQALQNARAAVNELLSQAGTEAEVNPASYPHSCPQPELSDEGWASLELEGAHVDAFASYALTSDVDSLSAGGRQPTNLLAADGSLMAGGWVERPGEGDLLRLHLTSNGQRVLDWLRDLSDGYVALGDDLHATAPGPIAVRVTQVPEWIDSLSSDESSVAVQKPYWVGIAAAASSGSDEALPNFTWDEAEEAELKRTSLYELHKDMGAKMVPFAGWDMPVWYTGVSEEHAAVRQAAGVFDVTHMGVFEASGPGAQTFLNTLAANDLSRLAPGKAHYSYLLAPDGSVIDDIYIYQLEIERYLIVVNADNNDRDWAWLAGVKQASYAIDEVRPWAKVPGASATQLRDLRDPVSGDDMRVDIALQGPASLDLLLSLNGDEQNRQALGSLAWSNVMQGTLAGFDLIIARTGYTGERIAYELFVHPDRAPALFETLINAGAVACGLAARDSLRTEAGLPLHGHELAGPLNLNPADAGFGGYVKTHKPFFVGRSAFLTHEAQRALQLVRFRMDEKGVRMPALGDPVVNRRGKVSGTVTSCAMDSDGYLLGLAYVNSTQASPGTPVGIFQTHGNPRPDKTKSELALGDRVHLHDRATVLTRFPKRK